MKIVQKLLLTILLLGISFQARSQEADSLQRFDYHMSFTTGVSSIMGNVHNFAVVDPSFNFNINPKLTLQAGFTVVSDIRMNNYQLQGQEPSSLAPRRSTSMIGSEVSAIYKVNDRLTVAGSVYYLGGELQPWFCPEGRPLDVNAYGFSASMSYKTRNNNRIDLYFDILHDDSGSISPMWYGNPYGWGHYGRHHGWGDPTWCLWY